MSQTEYTDSDLILRLRHNDISALEALYERYRTQVHRTAFAITHDVQAADDILHDSMLKVYQHAQRIDTNLPLAPWLYRVTVNLSYTWATRHKKRWLPIENFVENLISPVRNAPDRMAEESETQAQIRNAIESLQVNQRVVIVLHYLNDLDLQEIADILELPVGTVKSRLFYARESLRHKLGSLDWSAEVAHGYA
jgi:RNA polymerase sigma-70 factor (ECF subfamily)